jgi:hypothetical protein
MSQVLLYSIVESPTHPDFSALYRRLGIEQLRLASMRKAIAELKKRPPELVVAEFFYGYGNNYAGVNVSNLDVFLASKRKYAPEARVLVLVQPAELVFVDKLTELFPIAAVLSQPVTEEAMRTALEDLG